MTDRTNGTGPEAGGPRVLITGMGPITAVGIGVEGLWKGLQRCVSPIAEVTRFDPSVFRARSGAEVTGFDPADYMDPAASRKLDRYAHFSLASAHLAMKDAGLEPGDFDPERMAVQLGSALGGIAFAEDQYRLFLDGGMHRVNARLAISVYCGAASCRIAIEFGCMGPNATNSMSCAAGTVGIGEGVRLIRSGAADVVLAGGIEAAIAPLVYGAFTKIRAMSRRNDDPSRACRPFDKDRDGFVMGEGACVLVLESEEHARRRRARVYAEVAGYGTTNDAHHMTAPRPDGSQARRAMQNALRSAGAQATELDYINAHGSSTQLNDGTESIAIRSLYEPGENIAPVSGTKPFHGHALGASGAIEAAIVALAIQRSWIPPTLNLDEPGEDCDLDYVTGEGRDASVSLAMSNSFGFGGINAALVLRRV